MEINNNQGQEIAEEEFFDQFIDYLKTLPRGNYDYKPVEEKEQAVLEIYKLVKSAVGKQGPVTYELHMSIAPEDGVVTAIVKDFVLKEPKKLVAAAKKASSLEIYSKIDKSVEITLGVRGTSLMVRKESAND